MYGPFTYFWVVLGVNVSKHTLHWLSVYLSLYLSTSLHLTNPHFFKNPRVPSQSIRGNVRNLARFRLMLEPPLVIFNLVSWSDLVGRPSWPTLFVDPWEQGFPRNKKGGNMFAKIQHVPGSSKWPRLDPFLWPFTGLKTWPPFGESSLVTLKKLVVELLKMIAKKQIPNKFTTFCDVSNDDFHGTRKQHHTSKLNKSKPKVKGILATP